MDAILMPRAIIHIKYTYWEAVGGLIQLRDFPHASISAAVLDSNGVQMVSPVKGLKTKESMN